MIKPLSKRARIGIALVGIIVVLPSVARILLSGDFQVTRRPRSDVYTLGAFIALVGYVGFELLMTVLLSLDDEYQE